MMIACLGSENRFMTMCSYEMCDSHISNYEFDLHYVPNCWHLVSWLCLSSGVSVSTAMENILFTQLLMLVQSHSTGHRCGQAASYGDAQMFAGRLLQDWVCMQILSYRYPNKSTDYVAKLVVSIVIMWQTETRSSHIRGLMVSTFTFLNLANRGMPSTAYCVARYKFWRT